ncbi:MAG TPA: hypothetical protein VEY71_09565, partial [Chitinophagales bacterium]|nr:hypothetical protein [Chitinophagales bacterium]
MIRCIFAAALFAFVCIACNKSDPEKHPEYLGTWVSTDYSSNPCDYVITIATKENSTYAIAGSGCAMSTSVNGTCSI